MKGPGVFNIQLHTSAHAALTEFTALLFLKPTIFKLTFILHCESPIPKSLYS